MIQSSIRLSAHVLARQLAGQLTGRLLGNKAPSVRALLKQAAKWKAWPGLRPLIRTLEGHASDVTAVALTPDGRRAVSGSYDQTLRLWDLESGKEIAAFTEEGAMSPCTIAPDGQTIIAGDALGRMHFLRLVEADKTKLLPGEIKIPLLHRKGNSG